MTNRPQSTEPGEPITQVVAIDGPAGAGKSTVARRVADALGFAFLDTGASYRAATWLAMQQGIDWDDLAALEATVATMELTLDASQHPPRVTVNGEDVTRAIRARELTGNIHRIADRPELRAHLVALQRDLARPRPTVAEGRDMGTVVFPGARCKVYLDASVEERARRRAAELQAAGHEADEAAIQEEIAARDARDRARPVGALIQAQDAIPVDTTGKGIEEVVEEICALARERL